MIAERMSVEVRRNLCRNPRLTAVPATLVSDLMTYTVIDDFPGSPTAQRSVRRNVNSGSATRLAELRAALPAGTYLLSVSARVRLSRAGTINVSARSNVVDSSTNAVTIASLSLPEGMSTINESAVITRTASPSSSTGVAFAHPGAQSWATTGATVDIADVVIEIDGVSLPYFDGDTLPGGLDSAVWRTQWTGAPHNSESVLTENHWGPPV